MRKRILLSGIFFILSILALTSQTNSSTVVIPVTRYSTEAGLRQSMVTKVYQDKFGVLWILTGDGLHYYNGEKFCAVKTPNDSIFDISDQCLYNIKELDQQQFVASSVSSILMYNSQNCQFKKVHRKNRLYPILFEAEFADKALCWCYDKGVCIIDNAKLLPVTVEMNNKYYNSKDTVPIQILINKNNKLIIQYPHGIAEVNYENWSTSFNWKPKFFEFHGGVQLISRLHNKDIIGCFENKLCEYLGDGKLKILSETIFEFPRCIYEDHGGVIWISDIATNKLLRFSDNKFEQIQLIDYNRNDTLRPYIIDIFEDNNNDLWFGTDGDGLIFYERKFEPFKKINTGFVRCIKEFNNKIWVGTFKNGLWQISKDLTLSKKITTSGLDKVNNIFSLAIDKKDRLWIAATDGLRAMKQNEKADFFTL